MNVAQNTASTQATSLVGAFTNSSILKVYSGTIPATPETAIGAQTLLAIANLPASAAFTQAAGVMTAAAITSPTIASSGTASFVRWLKSDNATVIGDAYVGPSSGATAYSNSLVVTAGNFYTANGNTYICTTSGTTSASGPGPALKVSGLTDGTATFAYVDMLLGTTALVSGALLQINSFTFTVPSV